MMKKPSSNQLVMRGASRVIVEKDLNKRLKSGQKLHIKYGIDPTAGQIHIGRASTMRHLKHFQDLGHKVHIVIGSFTGTIGDSSDKDAERPMLTKEQVRSNMQSYKAQMSKILNVRKVKFHFNDSWFRRLDLAEFFRLQQLFSVAQMIERDNFWKRYKAGKRIGLHEFSYAILQGYDSVAIKADVEIGGTDQLFNMLAGRVVQKMYHLKPQNVITYELLAGTDGRKMSTSWGNCIYITDAPEIMFGKVMSINDNLMWDYYRLVSELSDKELKAVEKDLKAKKDPKGLKIRLALLITAMYHGQKAALKAQSQFASTFGAKNLPENIAEVKVVLGKRPVVDLLLETKLLTSKSDARRQLSQGAVRLNQVKLSVPDVEVSSGDVLQVGKRKFVRLI